MIESRQKITLRSVAREIGVSISYICNYPELSYRIQSFKDQQKYSALESDKSHLRVDNCPDTLKIENKTANVANRATQRPSEAAQNRQQAPRRFSSAEYAAANREQKA